jgi:hypothetical protein
VEDSGEQYVPTRYLDRWKKAPKISNGADLDLEKIAALKPDLIVSVDVPYLAKLYSKLTAIALTALAPFADDWLAYAPATADFVNEPKALAELKKTYTDRIASIKANYSGELSTYRWDVIQGGFDAGNYWIYGEDSPVGSILASLGAKFATATAAVKPGGNTSVSYATGAIGPLTGLSLPWTIVAIVGGSVFGTLFQAFHGAQGPRMGLPQMIQSRAQFGSRGARPSGDHRRRPPTRPSRQARQDRWPHAGKHGRYGQFRRSVSGRHPGGRSAGRPARCRGSHRIWRRSCASGGCPVRDEALPGSKRALTPKCYCPWFGGRRRGPNSGTLGHVLCPLRGCTRFGL